MKAKSILLITTIFCGCLGKVPERTELKGQVLPNFSITLLDGVTNYNINTLSIGKPSVLFYFSPRCPYCRSQMREITKNMDKLNNIQFCILTSFPFQETKQFYKEFKLDKYPNLIAGVDVTHSFDNYFKPLGVPFIAIYSRNKKLKEVHTGKTLAKQIKIVAEE